MDPPCTSDDDLAPERNFDHFNLRNQKIECIELPDPFAEKISDYFNDRSFLFNVIPQVSSDTYYNDTSLQMMEVPGMCIRRHVVIDGANVMGGMTVGDIGSLLGIVRFFVLNDFSVDVVLQESYIQSFSILQELQRVGNIVLPVPKGEDDDLAAIKRAHETNGVVISNDHFRQYELPSASFAARNTCFAQFYNLTANNQFRRSTDNRSFYGRRAFVLYPRASAQDTLFTYVFDGEKFETSVRFRKENWPFERRRVLLKLVDELIAELIGFSLDAIEKPQTSDFLGGQHYEEYKKELENNIAAWIRENHGENPRKGIDIFLSDELNVNNFP